ncbi:MAG: NAD-dependent epimerase/dehydratase family protein [Candidatus Hodarchaeota archaeon]
MKDERILVTGAGGFIGGHLAKYLRNKGYWVRGVDIKPHRWMKSEEFCDEFYLLDLTKWNDVVKSVKEIDQVYNLAANMGGIGYIMTRFAPVLWDNVTINKNIVEACRKFDVDRVLFSSSACIYPQYLQDKDFEKMNRKYILKEGDAFPADPDSFYGWEKLFSELIYWAYYLDYGLDVRIVRYHNIQGPMTEWEEPRCKAPAAICRKISKIPHKGGKIEVWGDGHQVRTFLNVKDCCEATYLTMSCSNEKYYSLGEKGKPRPPALNIGSNEETTINQLVDMIADISGKNVEKVHDLSKPQGVRSRSADLSCAKKIIGWGPKITLHKTMMELYQWVNSQLMIA